MRTALLVVAASVCLAAFAGCGDDDNGAAAKNTPTTNSSAATQANGTAATQAKSTTTTQATTSGGGSGSQAKVPADACALLTADDVAKLSTTAGPGKKLTTQPAQGQTIVACRWEWPEGVSTLDVKVMSLPAGVTTDMLKASFQAEIKSNGRVLSGVGDFAIVESPISADAMVRVLVKGLEMDVELNGLGARDKQEQLITVAKAALGRVQ